MMYRVLGALFMAAAAAGTALAAGDEPTDNASALKPAVDAIHAGKFADAIARLEPYTLQFPKDANGWNWLGYAYRKNGQLPLAFARYERALAVDPQHRGAHEYIGEAYLQERKPELAEKHLKALESICRANCEEYQELKQAVADYRAKMPR